MTGSIAIIGTGYVADLYMRSLSAFPQIRLVAAYDIDAARLAAFSAHWQAPAVPSLEALFQAKPDLILNLTNPHAHYGVSRACLEAGFPVYSEKPLATRLEDAEALHALAREKGLSLASAPCSLLGESAQTAWLALRQGAIGTPRLAYAELDDGFITQAPYRHWISESGAPWPAQDEFATGCTLEHAGYYLTWLMAMFGPVRQVAAASAHTSGIPLENGGPPAPDYSCATLFFEGGMVARLTCSIIARHDHQIRIFGDTGTLELGECWDNDAPVRIRPRFTLRRRLIESPLRRRFRLKGPTHPKVTRRGAATMNFMLGPAEVLEAQAGNRRPRLDADFALHLTEVTLAIQEAADRGVSVPVKSRFTPPEPMPWAAA
ncbi:Gfo/Idh/MocA family oxidoreductase [Roseomonas sp. GC11]|uniref:Gfo/Idh/MocA family protein n=1 Tax=Roseomonas sp. GC11 TaxID=2950546 RepID=UPI00210ADD1D|nr:Gfo/Idh/MocA family oxidoreductase [Roseomonas sp. GC11]MCQ4162326.1 Gfo/Idh/MocA family oxidoreductase [Roseomonas sp. GC11]